MFLLLLRTFVIYLLIILAMRLMGKKQLGELQPSELVSTILISNLASISIESPELPVMGSIVPVFAIVAMEILLSALCVKSPRAAKLMSGSPRVIIRNGRIEQATLRELRFTVDDLMEALRAKDVFELDEVAFAVVETNGTVSVQKKFAGSPVTNGALDVPAPAARQPSLPMVCDGAFEDENLRAYGLDRAWAKKECERRGCPVQDVLLLLCNDAHETLLVRREGVR